MAKKSTVEYVCNNCGHESKKWYGRCPVCNEWNSFSEFRVDTSVSRSSRKKESLYQKPTQLFNVKTGEDTRLSTGFAELDRVLGGKDKRVGVVDGSVTLLSGDPGVGKSTLLLQATLALSRSGKRVLYVSGEESEGQVRMRAERIVGVKKIPEQLFLLSSTDTDEIVSACKKGSYSLVVIDSIQTIASTSAAGFAGSVPQIRYGASSLVSYAKSNNVPIFMIGHVTKEGIVAGPMVLSHMVDVVLYLEGDEVSGTRVLRSHKNRFGDTSEVGIFLMEEKGLIELADASSFFVDRKDIRVPGAALTVVMEGSRPLLVEIQALCVPSNLAFARRVSNGFDPKRLEILLAVLKKHVKIPVEKLDIFVNVVGGLKIRDTAADLACCLALYSSYKNVSLSDTVAIGEIGLLGELKRVVNQDVRLREISRLGTMKALSSKNGTFLKDIITKYE